MAYVVIQQHKFGRMYLCGWSKRWGATVCANRFVAIKFPTEDEAKLARDHAATRCPQFTDGRPIDWQVLELPPSRAMRRLNEECRYRRRKPHPSNLPHSSGLATKKVAT